MSEPGCSTRFKTHVAIAAALLLPAGPGCQKSPLSVSGPGFTLTAPPGYTDRLDSNHNPEHMAVVGNGPRYKEQFTHLEIHRTNTPLTQLDAAACEQFRLDLIEEEHQLHKNDSAVLNSILGVTHYAYEYDPAVIQTFPFGPACAVGVFHVKFSIWEIQFLAIHAGGRWTFECEGGEETLPQKCQALLNGFRFVP